MKITQVQAQVLHSYEYPNGGWVLVRVHTEDARVRRLNQLRRLRKKPSDLSLARLLLLRRVGGGRLGRGRAGGRGP